MLCDSKYSEENWIACARNGKDKNSSAMKHSDASSVHIVSACFSLSDRCSESTKRYGMSAQKRRDKQKDKGVVYWQSRQTPPVWTMVCTRFDRGPVWRTVWIHRRQNFILDTYRLQFFTDCQVQCHITRANRKNVRNDKWTWEILFIGLLYTITDNFHT